MTISEAAIAPSVPRVPGSAPLVGHALKMWRDPFGFLKSLSDYGDLVRIDLGRMPLYVPTTGELVHEVTVGQARSFEKGRFFDRLRPLAGNGIANSDGDIHRQHRRLIQPMFSKDRIAGYAEVMSQSAQDLADSWTPGQEVELNHAMAQYAIETLAATMFSTDIGLPAVQAVRTNLPIALKNLLVRAASPKFLDRLPIRANRDFDNAVANLRSVIDEVIATGRRTADTGKGDLLSLLLAERDLSDVQVRDELSTIMFAGAETTAATLAWAFYYLAYNPEAEKKVVAEIQEVVGDRPVTVEDVPRLPAVRRILEEVVRLHGVTILMRRTTEPVELGGYQLPTGAEVGFSLYALHRDPRVFAQPDTFDPDRWLPERQAEAKVQRKSYMPFGAGSHKCIGDQFAYTEATIALATLLPRWRLVPVAGHTPKEVVSVVPHADYVPMTVHPRHE